MNLYWLFMLLPYIVVAILIGMILAITKMYNKQVLELTRALIAKNLTDYTVNTVGTAKEEEPSSEPDVIPAEEASDEEFDKQIKEQLNG